LKYEYFGYIIGQYSGFHTENELKVAFILMNISGTHIHALSLFY